MYTMEDIRFDMDVEYGRALNWLGDTTVLLMDVYYPADEVDTLASRPLIVYLHGGGFHGGSKSNQKGRYWAQEFVKRGYVFASIDYRLGWPNGDSCAADTSLYMRAVYRAVQDTRAALRWLTVNADSWRLDPSHFYLLGTSAGSGASMFASYAEDADFGSYLSEELGPLDESGNALSNEFHIAGMITKSAALSKLDVLDRKEIPHLLFHGSCDMTVPYTYGAIFHCYAPNKFVDVYGSGDIGAELERLNRCHTLYKNIGQGHGTVDDDTVVVYGAAFIQSLLCEDCESRYIERISRLNVCADRSGKTTTVENLYPNPSNGIFRVVVSGPRDEDIDLSMIDRLGRVVFEESKYYVAPIQHWRIEMPQLEPGVYYFKTGVRNRFTVQPVLIIPDGPSAF